MGFPRLELNRQAELGPVFLNNVHDKPPPQQDW